MRTVIRHLYLTILLIVACTTLTACGNKNALYYPEHLPEAQTSTPSAESLEENKTKQAHEKNNQ